MVDEPHQSGFGMGEVMGTNKDKTTVGDDIANDTHITHCPIADSIGE